MEKKIYEIAKVVFPFAFITPIEKNSDCEFSFSIMIHAIDAIFVDIDKRKDDFFVRVELARFYDRGRNLKIQKMFYGAAPVLADGSLNEVFFELLFTHYSSFGR